MTRTALASLAAGALAAGGLAAAAVPAQAAPVFSDLYTWHGTGSWGNNCALDPEVAVNPGDVTLTPNVAKTTEVSVSRTGAANGDATDTISLSSQVRGTSLATTAGSLPKRLELKYSGSSKLTTAKATSVCEVQANADMGLEYKFTSTVPLWATLSYNKKGSAYVEAYVYRKNQTPYEDLYGRALDGSGSVTVYLPAGEWGGYLEANPFIENANSTRTLAASGVVSIDFAIPGSAVSGPSGKAQSYAKLASARSCAVHTLPAKLTTSTKRLKQTKKIAFSVNGKTVKTLKGKSLKRGAAVNLTLRDSSKASVKTTVTLKSGKKITAQANYRACGA